MVTERFIMKYLFAIGFAFCTFAPVGAAPQGPADWKVEVVAEQPTINYCSVVCCAPDGRVFVAEDPMDMVGPSNQPIDRIMCLHPDGKWTVFADKLYAVFGLVYMDGKLYVHHSPKFSVFDDAGTVGTNRVDLIGCTNPKPWAGMNDHIPSNFRLGMDGWFYMSTGDKGIYGAVGTDGSKAEIHGGGVMRFRPDGTHLEVFSTGTRNHLDVAMNAEDEIFTYDNTDDGNGWWTRLTHMVDGGFYGYPYDYKPRRPYTLWMMGDDGGGSPTGGLAYNEDALPEEYRGNLFMCEWGKGQLVRFLVDRDGGTFKIKRRDVFLSKGSNDFRPVGIAVSPDGMSLYIADWNYGGWSNRTVKAGRLIKATYQGKSQSAPKPDWYVPLATGKPFQTTPASLLHGLRHPAQSVRFVAMRRLAERANADIVASLIKLLSDKKASNEARWSALWTLDRIDGGRTSQSAILAALRSDNASLRRQVARQLGTRGVKEAVPQLLELLAKDSDQSVRFHAATALGHIGDPGAVDGLLASLTETDLFTRYASFTALGRIGRAQPQAWPAIAMGLTSDQKLVREGTLFAFRETYDATAVTALARVAVDSTKSGETRGAVLALLGELSRQRPAWRGQWWGTQPVRSLPPARTETWAGTELALTALREGIGVADPLARQGAGQGMIASNDPQLALALVKHLATEQDAPSRKSMLEALGRARNTDDAFVAAANKLCADFLHAGSMVSDTLLLAATLSKVTPELTAAMLKLASRDLPAGQQIAVLESLARSKSAGVVPALLVNLEHKNAEVRARTVQLLATRRGEAISKALVSALEDKAAAVRKEAAISLGRRKDKAALPALLALVKDGDLSFDAVNALAQMPDVRAVAIYLDGLGSKNSKQREDCGRAIAVIKKDALPLIEERLQRKPALPPSVLLQLQKVYKNVGQAKDSPLFKSAAAEISIDDFIAASLKEKGNRFRGRALFLDAKGVACAKCHRVGKEGGEVGPDLSGIGLKYNRPQLIESVLYPSKQILDGYDVHIIETKNGQVLSGIIRAETGAGITLVDAEGKLHTVKLSDLESNTKSPKSIMPDGLQTNLTIAEFADLITFLESLKEKMPQTAPPAKNSSQALRLSPARQQKPAKVFILAGQSNMEGKAKVALLDYQAQQPATRVFFKHLRKDNGWIERPDVWIKYLEHKGQLTVGYGSPRCIGPELEFGIVVGDHFDEQVLLIKTAWGGRSLFRDFRPPSAGLPALAVLEKLLTDKQKSNPKATLDDVKRSFGASYRAMLEEVRSTLANLKALSPTTPAKATRSPGSSSSRAGMT
jgi:putative membrane-bound dehydrogenase-like protein